MHSLPTAILVPHASYDMVCEALHRSFERVQSLKPSIVVFLGPLHQEVLAEHEPAFLITFASKGIRIAGREHHFHEALTEKLCSKFPDIIRQDDSYFIEEPAFELTLPFIDSYFCGVPTLALLCAGCDKQQLSLYCRVLEHITNQFSSVLFIVSSNANALLPSPEAAKHASAFLDAITSGTSLCEGQRMHVISSCNSAALDAVARQKWACGTWDVTGIFTGGSERTGILAEPDEKEKRVWHISAVPGAPHENQ